MDFFRLLSRGAKLDHDSEIFTKKQEKKADDSERIVRELDFFHTKTPSHEHDDNKSKKQKNKADEDDTDQKPKFAKIESTIPYRKSNIKGSDVPQPLTTFEELGPRFGLSEQLLSRIRFATPTQIQAEAIPGILHDRDILACAPTGSGKTLAYVLPLVELIRKVNENEKSSSAGMIKGLILVPTKELATQVLEQFTILTASGRAGVKANVLSKSLLARLTSDSSDRPRPGDVLIATPLRLVRALNVIGLDSLRHLVLDEADRLFDTTFAEQTDQILATIAKTRQSSLQKTFLSATMPSSIETMALNLMVDPLRIFISPGRAAATVDQKLVFAGSESGKLVAIRQMVKGGELPPPVLIFVQSVERANALMHELVYDGVNVDVIHGERTESQRKAVVEKFKKAQVWVLICTDVFARGIDVHGVNVVINYDVPQSAQAYIHRIGRTGRAGRTGKAVTFFTKEDVEAVKIVVNVMRESGCEVQEWMTRMGKADKQMKKQLKRKPAERDEIGTQQKKLKAVEKKHMKAERDKREEAKRKKEEKKRRKKKVAAAAASSDKEDEEEED
ncbi:DEAD box RNA helicase [Myxozyma melibiosi]|uniref:RNA helicase n=1 Tax=Myxozyma melibiosi TaxID=54550 RepID=A0ABR1F523_9ASCO